jgi:hypothetical protein
MTIHLDHLMIPARNKIASAKLLANLLGVPQLKREHIYFIILQTLALAGYSKHFCSKLPVSARLSLNIPRRKRITTLHAPVFKSGLEPAYTLLRCAVCE